MLPTRAVDACLQEISCGRLSPAGVAADHLCMATYYLYILSSRRRRHLSIGVTGDLVYGIKARRQQVNRRLRKKRVLQKLVYIEALHSVEDAVEREIGLNKASRETIDRLVESVNPSWDGISVSELVRVGFE